MINNLQITGILIFLFSVFISSCSQILLKMSAKIQYDNKWKEYLNTRVIAAYSIFFISSLVTLYAYRFVPLSMGPVLEASGYIFVTVLGVTFLKEKVGVRKRIGLVIIVTGIMITALFG